MKKYCLDTSGISKPLYDVPPDIHVTLWEQVEALIASGIFAVTYEIYEELQKIPEGFGEMVKDYRDQLLLEIGDDDWDFAAYIAASNELNDKHHGFISEYIGGSKRTVGLNDMTIISLGKSLHLPVISMEVSTNSSPKYKRIPDICHIEGIDHLTFNDLLRAEKISL